MHLSKNALYEGEISLVDIQLRVPGQAKFTAHRLRVTLRDKTGRTLSTAGAVTDAHGQAMVTIPLRQGWVGRYRAVVEDLTYPEQTIPLAQKPLLAVLPPLGGQPKHHAEIRDEKGTFFGAITPPDIWWSPTKRTTVSFHSSRTMSRKGFFGLIRAGPQSEVV